MNRFAPLVLFLLLAACSDRPTISTLSPTLSGQEARNLFGAETFASEGAPEVFGSYANGCVAGAQQLPETGPTWQAMRLSRNRNWGHPELLDYVADLSAEVVRSTSWAGLYVGDMSQPRGGPMLTGHASHQSGLDVDIWMYPPTRLDLTREERESLSSINVRAGNGAGVNENWTADHATVLRLAASDPRVERIFVTVGVKDWLCRNTPEGGDRDWLSRLRPAAGHNYHFHVRLACPAGSRDCVTQVAVPPGDGCDAAAAQVAAILNPPPPSTTPVTPAPPGPPSGMNVTLGQLPRQCPALLSML